MKTNYFLPVAAISLFCSLSCSKKEVKTSPVEFYLMDSPTNYDSVNIHIRKIEARIVGDSAVLLPIRTKDTVVNLFHFQDSLTLMIARDVVPLGVLKEIHFFLGDDNTVVVNGKTYPLQLPDGDSKELLVRIDKRLNEVFNGIILDFDASQSIVAEDSVYKLQPVVTAIR